MIFVFADEAFYAGDKQHEASSKASSPRIAAHRAEIPHRRHGREHAAPDDVVQQGLGDAGNPRRTALPDAATAADHIGDFAYFAALNAQMANGGLAAMLHDLLTMDIGDFHPRRSVPDTPELAEQKMHSLDTRPPLVDRRAGARLRLEVPLRPPGVPALGRIRHHRTAGTGPMPSGARRTASPTRRTANCSARCWPPSIRRAVRAPHPVYEADSVDPTNPQPVVKLGNQIGYKVGTLDNARALFSKAIGRAADTSEWDTPLSC